MAGDWIKFEVSTSDKPEVWAIADSLGIDPDAVVGKLLRVWAWFDQQTETGNAPSVTKALLDRAVGVKGFCQCMVDAGWMGDDSKTITLPNFDRHNGKTAKNRALTAKRVAAHKKKSNANGNGSGVTQALPKEEKRTKENTSDGDYAFFGKIVRITHKQFQEWQTTYDAIPDLNAQLTSFDDYYDANLKGDDRKKWFMRCSTALGNKHQKFKVEAPTKKDTQLSAPAIGTPEAKAQEEKWGWS